MLKTIWEVICEGRTILQKRMARVTGLEPATSGVTGRHSNQLSYTRAFASVCFEAMALN